MDSSETSDQSQLFFSSIIRGDMNTVRILLSEGIRINDIVYGPSKKSALHLAAERNHVEICRLLLDLGAATDAEDAQGNTALHLTQTHAAHSILSRGCDVDKRNTSGRTCLHNAVINKDELLVRKMLEHSGIGVNMTDCDGNTPLHLACLVDSPNVGILQALLSAQCEKYAVNNKSLTAFEVALARDRFECGQLMIEAGFDVNSAVLIDQDGSGPIHGVLERWPGDLRKVKFLVDCGAVVNLKNCDGETPLHMAISYACSVELIHVLSSGQCNFNAVNNHGNTALHLAVENSADDDILNYLCSANCDVNMRNTLGMTPMHMLKYINFDEEPQIILSIIRFLAQHGSEVNAQDSFGCTPLFYVIKFSEQPKLVELLLNNGADVNVRDKCGIDLLSSIQCISNSNEFQSTFDLLMDYGAKINALDNYQASALHHAVWYRNTTAVQTLLKRGIDVNQKDTMGFTAMDLANTFGIHELSEILNCSGSRCVSLDGSQLSGPRPAQWDTSVLTINCHIEDLEVSSPDEVTKEALKIPENYDSERYLKSILYSPMVGKLTPSKEVDAIKEHIWNLFRYCARKIDKVAPHLAFTPNLRGSVNEDTKCGLLDEFDFLCHLDVFAKVCDVREEDDDPPNYIRVRPRKPKISDFNYKKYFDEHGNLNSGAVILEFHWHLQNIFLDADTWINTPLYYEVEVVTHSVALPFSVKWHGVMYKSLTISIDVVPTICVPNFWPKSADPPSIVPKATKLQGCEIVFCLEEDKRMKDEERYFRVSFSLAEQYLFKHIVPEPVKDGYILAKAMRSGFVCPPVITEKGYKLTGDELGSQTSSLEADDFQCSEIEAPDVDTSLENDEGNVVDLAELAIPSYWLKSALWQEMSEIIDSGESLHMHDTSSEERDQVAIYWARKIYSRLETSMKDGVLSSIFSSDVNLLQKTYTGDVIYSVLRKSGDELEAKGSIDDASGDLAATSGVEMSGEYALEDLNNARIFTRIINILLDNTT